jgi:hypothetical protein
VNSEDYFTSYKSFDFDKEINQIYLQNDSLIVHFFDNLVTVFSLQLIFNNHNQVIDFTLQSKAKIEEFQVQIFENVCIYQQNNCLVLNSCSNENNTISLNRKGVFQINSILENDLIPSDHDLTLNQESNIVNSSVVFFFCFFLESKSLT